jgi:hypothetical protein
MSSEPVATVRVGRCGRSASSERVCDQPNHGRADRDRNRIRVCRMAWILRLTVRECRELEASDRLTDFKTYNAIERLYGCEGVRWWRPSVGCGGLAREANESHWTANG